MSNRELTTPLDAYYALKKDYEKLLIQVQAELVQKEYYKKKVSDLSGLMAIKDVKIFNLNMALGQAVEKESK